ncbi:glutaredoxin [Pantoea ananatis BRT98]|nr:glutaredoxin [Pantoea ananatis BRT98]
MDPDERVDSAQADLTNMAVCPNGKKISFSVLKGSRYNKETRSDELRKAIMSTVEKIQRQIAENPILLYMKGSPKLPSCGFSAQAVQALSACGERFAYVDILQNPDIRAELPKYANWPTFPQLWVDGELVGGCDIIVEMFQRGELQPLVKETAEKFKEAE